jgi:hypothetical protein
MKALKTGDNKTFRSFDADSVWQDDKWVVMDRELKFIACGAPDRDFARRARETEDGERIGKIIKRTPKTLTIQISK